MFGDTAVEPLYSFPRVTLPLLIISLAIIKEKDQMTKANGKTYMHIDALMCHDILERPTAAELTVICIITYRFFFWHSFSQL